MLITIAAKQGFGIKVQKFTHHPIAVGQNPKYDSKIMAKLAHELTGSDGDYNGNNKRWEYHGNA